MASDEDPDADQDVLLLVHQLPVDMEEPHEGRLAHLLAPLHRPPAPPAPFRPPPPPQAAASVEPRLSFRGWLGTPRHWDLWVAKLRPLHAPLWRRLGIHDAVLASTCRFKRDATALLHLASFWSPATSTFAFPWGEATLTLHDIASLAGFPADGAPVPAPLPPHWRPDDAALNGVRLGFNRSACKKAHHSAWVKHFLTDHHDPVLEHAAFLALWLTRFVLPGHPESTMRQALFPVAVRLARGDRLALGPAVLASLYRDLRDIKAFLLAATAAATTGNADTLSSSLPLYAPVYILQLWMWERFPALRPARDVPPVRDGEPVAARWHDLSRKLNPALVRDALTSGANFVWQLPYSTSLTRFSGWVCNTDLEGNQELRLLAYSLRPCELVGMDCIEQYLPHRVARQFGLDQDVPADVRRANQDWEVAWRTYELKGKNVTFFIPQSEPGVTARYAQWWRQQLPPSHLHAGAPSFPAAEWKSSKRKVKKTQVAMEAEAEKERKTKKARVSPTMDKKRKLEDLYDPTLSSWLAAGRTGISGASGGSCKAGSSPNYYMGSDEALLPNIGGTNDDVVLLVPRVQTPSPAVVMPKQCDTMNPPTGDRGSFVVDKPPDIPNDEHEGVVAATLVEEKPNMPADSSLDTTDSPEEGATAVMELEKGAVEKRSIPADRPLDLTDRPEEGDTVVMELEKEASGVPDRPEEVTAPVIDEKEETAAIEGDICVTEMNPLENNKHIVAEADEGNKVSEEAESTAGESIETVQQNQQDGDAGGINNSHDAVPLAEEALPIQHASNIGGCSNFTCIMEDSNVAGSMGTNDGETNCHDSVDEDKREVSCVEEIGGGEHSQIVEKDGKEKPPETPSTEIVDHEEDIVPIGTDNDSDKTELPPTMEKVVVSDSMDATLLGVGIPEAEHVELDKDHNLAKKDAEDMPMEVKNVEAVEQVQISALARGSAEEDKEFSEVDHTDIVDPKMHSNLNTETPDKAAEVEHAEIDGATGLTGRDNDGNIGDVPEIGYTNVKEVRRLIMNASDEKHGEVSQVEHAEVKDTKDLMQEPTNNKFEEIPELENPGLEETYGPKEEHFDDNLNKVHDGNAEEEKFNEHEKDGHRLKGILQVDLLTRDEARSLVKEDVEDNTATVPQVEHENLRDELPVDEGTRQKPCAEGNDGPEKDLDESKEVYKVKQEVEDCKVLMEKDDNNVTDALGVEQAAEGQGKAFAEKGIHDHVEEITQVEQVDGQSERLTRTDTEEISEEITRGHEAEFDTDLVEASKDSTIGEMLCSSAKVQLKDQMEVSEESMMEEKCIQDGELRNKRETSSDAVAMSTEEVYDHKTLDVHQESVLKQKQDHIIICENREATISESSHMQCSGVKSNLVPLMVDETHAAGGTQNLEISDLDRQGSMEERQDVGTTIDNSETKLPEDADSLICTEDQTDPICTEVNEAELTKGMQNQELLDDKEQQLMEERQDSGNTIGNSRIDLLEDSDILVCSENQVDPTCTKVNWVESTERTLILLDNKEKLTIEERQHLETRNENKKINVLEEADILVCGEYQIDPTDTEVNVVECTKENKLLDCKDDEVEKRTELEVTDASGISLEEAYKHGGGVDTYADTVNFDDSSQNKEACSMEEAREDKEHHGIEHANKKMILENTSVIDSGALKSDVLEVHMAGSRDGTDLCALSVEKEVAVQEEQDQEMTDEDSQDTNRDVADIDALECGGVKPDDETMKMFHETLHTTRAVDVVGSRISPDNKQRGATFEEYNVTEVVGSETNQTEKMEPEGALPPEPENLFEVEQENLENEPERPIFRGNDDASCKDQSSAEVMTAPSNMDDRGEDDNEWAEESTKGYDKLASDSINASCHQPTKFCRPSNEEVKRSHNMRSMYLKDIKESLGRIRAEPSNRVHITGVGYNNPQHSVQEPISACKEIKVPLRDSARDFVRDRGPDLVVTSPAEETSRWRQEQYALQILEDVQNARIAEKTRMEMEIRILKAQIAGMERQVMNLDNFSEVKSRSRRH